MKTFMLLVISVGLALAMLLLLSALAFSGATFAKPELALDQLATMQHVWSWLAITSVAVWVISVGILVLTRCIAIRWNLAAPEQSTYALNIVVTISLILFCYAIVSSWSCPHLVRSNGDFKVRRPEGGYRPLFGEELKSVLWARLRLWCTYALIGGIQSFAVLSKCVVVLRQPVWSQNSGEASER